jgi:hypothetical protein
MTKADLQWCTNGSEWETAILLDCCPLLARFIGFGVEHAVAHEDGEGDNGTNRDCYIISFGDLYE